MNEIAAIRHMNCMFAHEAGSGVERNAGLELGRHYINQRGRQKSRNVSVA